MVTAVLPPALTVSSVTLKARPVMPATLNAVNALDPLSMSANPASLLANFLELCVSINAHQVPSPTLEHAPNVKTIVLNVRMQLHAPSAPLDSLSNSTSVTLLALTGTTINKESALLVILPAPLALVLVPTAALNAMLDGCLVAPSVDQDAPMVNT